MLCDRKGIEIIANQLKEDKLQDDLSNKEYVDPFTGKKVRQIGLFKRWPYRP